MVIPNFVQSALRNDTIRVFGDGEQTRCFTYVGDAVRAAVTLMNTPEAEGEVYNIGGGMEISMNQLAARVCELASSSSSIENIPYHEVYGPGFEDMRRRTPDITKLQSLTGYEPSYDIDDILRDVIDHYRHRDGLHISVPTAFAMTGTG